LIDRRDSPQLDQLNYLVHSKSGLPDAKRFPLCR
jgi:hypothetical protein